MKLFKTMGNSTHRPIPLKNFNSEEGKFIFYHYGANSITGWRREQADRYICLPKFREDQSYFAVYDGHGGEAVVQYIQRYLHHVVFNNLQLFDDIELALYLSFIICDDNLRNITDEEFAIIEEDLNDKDPELNERRDRRKVLEEFSSLISTPTETGKYGANSNTGTTSKAGCSSDVNSIFNQLPDDIKDDEMKIIKHAPLVYLLHSDIAKETDSDESFVPDMSGSSSVSGSGASALSGESATNESEDSEEKIAKEAENDDEELNEDKQKFGNGCHSEMNIQSEPLDNEDIQKKNEGCKEPKLKAAKKKIKPQFGQECGATATVVLVSKKSITIASIGDSRCVACINGQAVNLSFDHRPTNEEECIRIVSAGGSISADGRVNGILDMSRAFGDFEMKVKDVEAPFQVLSCEPNITTIDVTPDLEFIIIASDGIWNSISSEEAVTYIRTRIQDSEMELRDICGELFEELLPSEYNTDGNDGNGYDNMTAILIQMKNWKSSSIKEFKSTGVYTYNYSPEPGNDAATNKQVMLATQDNSEMNLNDPENNHQSHLCDESLYTSEQDCGTDFDMMLEPIPGCHNSNSSQDPANQSHQNLTAYLGKNLLLTDIFHTKFYEMNREFDSMRNQFNELNFMMERMRSNINNVSAGMNIVKATLQNEITKCNDRNYFNNADAFSAALDILQQLINCYNQQNVAGTSTNTSAYTYADTDTPSTSFSTSHTHQNASNALRLSSRHLKKRLTSGHVEAIIDLTCEDNSSGVDSAEIEHNVQVTKRSVEDTDEVSKKLKTDDYSVEEIEKKK